MRGVWSLLWDLVRIDAVSLSEYGGYELSTTYTRGVLSVSYPGFSVLNTSSSPLLNVLLGVPLSSKHRCFRSSSDVRPAISPHCKGPRTGEHSTQRQARRRFGLKKNKQCAMTVHPGCFVPLPARLPAPRHEFPHPAINATLHRRSTNHCPPTRYIGDYRVKTEENDKGHEDEGNMPATLSSSRPIAPRATRRNTGTLVPKEQHPPQRLAVSSIRGSGSDLARGRQCSSANRRAAVIYEIKAWSLVGTPSFGVPY